VYPVTYVDASANCSVEACTGSATNPLDNLTAGIERGPAQYGGQIYVKPGVYKGPANREISVTTKRLFISQWPSTVGSVVVDCEKQSSGFMFFDGEYALSDLVIQNCTTSSPTGGAVIYSYSSRLALNNVTLLANSTTGQGGGMTVELGLAFVYGGAFVGNSASGGGGGVLVNTSH